MRGAVDQRITPDVIKRIRQLAEQGVTYQQLADRFGIAKATISLVVNRRKHYADKVDAA